MNKKTLKNIKEIHLQMVKLHDVPGLWIDSETGKLSLSNSMMFIHFDISKEEENQILEYCECKDTIKKSDLFHNAFEEFDNGGEDSYPNDWTDVVMVPELEKEVKELKKKHYKRKKIYIEQLKPIEENLKTDHNSSYNIELFLDTCRCLDEDYLSVSYPRESLKPLIIEGNKGIAMVCPVNYVK